MKNNNDDGTVQLGGKTYYTVARRVADFRALHPISEGWGIITSIVECNPEIVIFRAAVSSISGREVAVGYAEEKRGSSQVNRTSALENCETSAIGRALAAAGFGGTQYASANEVEQAIHQQRLPPQGFLDALSRLGLELQAVDIHCLELGWGSPASWNSDQRRRFIGDLESGAIPALYLPQVES